MRFRGDIDRAHLGRTSGLRVDRDRAGVREQVQHALARGPVADRAPALAQIGEQSRRQRRGDIDDEFQIVFSDFELDRRRVAAHELGGRLARRFTAERAKAALLVDRLRVQLVIERGEQLVAQPAASGGDDRVRVQLHDEVVAVALDDDARQPVRLGVDEPDTAELVEVDDALAQRDRCPDTLADELAVDRDVRIADEDAQRDDRVRVVEATSDELAVRVDAIDRGPRLR